MKEVIYFVGKGFLSVIIGGLVWGVVCYSASNFSKSKKVESDRSLYQYEVDAAYLESMTQNDVQVEWIYPGAIPQITELPVDKFFQVTGNNAESLSLSVVSVCEERTGNPVSCVNGKYYFLRSGIYKIYVRCGKEIYLVRVPVNVAEGDE